jgi:hypothetical protein
VRGPRTICFSDKCHVANITAKESSRHPLPQRPSHTGRERRIWVADAHPLVWLLHLLNFPLGVGVRQRGHRATKQRGGAEDSGGAKRTTRHHTLGRDIRIGGLGLGGRFPDSRKKPALSKVKAL